MDESVDNLSSFRDKLKVFYYVLKYRPVFVTFIVFFSIFSGLMEGIGLTFIYPIFEIAEAGPEQIDSEDRIINIFITVYETLGVTVNLQNLLLGVSAVIIVRYSANFGLDWLKARLSGSYKAHLKKEAFRNTLEAKIKFFDDKGKDQIVHNTLTETDHSSKSIIKGVEVLQEFSLLLIYFIVMLIISPILTLIAMLLLGGIMGLLRFIVQPSISMESNITEADEIIQENVNAGIYGIRDVKLFKLSERISENVANALENIKTAQIKLKRNETGMENFYKMSAALGLFLIIYVGFTYTELSLGELGVFLVAMFQLAPKISTLNSRIYRLEGHLSHFMRTQKYLNELNHLQEKQEGEKIEEIENIQFDNVSFSYEEDEKVLENIEFEVRKNQFIAFVGESGAGKSTIASLISRLYEPDQGNIYSTGKEINEYNLKKWREKLAVVRQQAFIFNMTLIENVKIGEPEATREEIKQVCKIAQVEEFLDDLPNGYNSELGSNGVKLSGGQRQRVSIARALLKNPDFLILDEATSDLDSNLEEKVHESIEKIDKDFGIIAIAHQLSTINNADNIYVLEEGKIKEKGRHQELVNKEGLYKELYNSQKKD